MNQFAVSSPGITSVIVTHEYCPSLPGLLKKLFLPRGDRHLLGGETGKIDSSGVVRDLCFLKNSFQEEENQRFGVNHFTFKLKA